MTAAKKIKFAVLGNKLKKKYSKLKTKILKKAKELEKTKKVLKDALRRRILSERALKESSERLETLVENAPIGIYSNDFTGTFLFGSKKAEEIVGYKREELIGKNFLNLHLLSLGDIPKAAKLLTLNRLGVGTGPDEFIITRKDGQKRCVEINSNIITLAGKKVVLSMVGYNKPQVG
jgi:PAS domain S-box-containing protein